MFIIVSVERWKREHRLDSRPKYASGYISHHHKKMIKLLASSSTSRFVALILVAASLFQIYYFLMISSSCVRVTRHALRSSEQQVGLLLFIFIHLREGC